MKLTVQLDDVSSRAQTILHMIVSSGGLVYLQYGAESRATSIAVALAVGLSYGRLINPVEAHGKQPR